MSDAMPANSAAAIRHLHNEFGPYLNDLEYRIGMFIIMRTHMFNKASEYIAVRQFCEGVFSKTKGLSTAGVNKSRSTVLAAIAKLESIGAITRTEIPGRFTEYSFNMRTTARMIAAKLGMAPQGEAEEGSEIPDTYPSEIPDTPVRDSGPPSKTSILKLENKTSRVAREDA